MARRDIVVRLRGLIKGMYNARFKPLKANTFCESLDMHIHPAYKILDIVDKLYSRYVDLRKEVTEEQYSANKKRIDRLDKILARQTLDYNKCIGGLCAAHVDFFS